MSERMPFPSFPVYLVVSQRNYNTHPALSKFGLPNNILRVIRCDVLEVDDYYKAIVWPLQNSMPGIETIIYTRPADVSLFEQTVLEEQQAELARTLETVDRILDKTATELGEPVGDNEIGVWEGETGWLPGDD